ncbi:MAG TPA: multicopper oxidase domain-containing protein [Bacteroidia bacterium]|jgi:FtsP/CotA-like multicopper oxidase with cupredoxin domain|nr:multicopper oxidase domain-containing protein [Bacteroidia bacterium]
MKIKLLTIVFLLECFISNAQTNREYSVVMRSNVGKAVMWDNVSMRIFGFAPNLSAQPQLPGVTLYAEEGDSVFINAAAISQGDEHTVHLHGLDVDTRNDGDPMTSHPIGHLQTRTYKFYAAHAGTYTYHCHVDDVVHVQMGMYGLLIIKAKGGLKTAWTNGPDYDKEFSWLSSEIDRSWHDTIPKMIGDTLRVPKYKPGYFLINGKSEQQIESDDSTKIDGVPNDKLYIRLANIGYYYHRFIFPPELHAVLIDSDGRPLPTFIKTDTVIVMPGERYGVMLNPTALFSGTIAVEYANMNTHVIANTQHVPVLIHEPLTIEENEAPENSVTLYPNPATNELFIISTSTTIQDVELELINSLGQQVRKMKVILDMSPTLLKTDDLPGGVYQVKMNCSHACIYKKLVITK